MSATLETRNVFLDTECFYRGGFNYSSKPFRILTSLAAKDEVQVFVTDITVREVLAHVTEGVRGNGPPEAAAYSPLVSPNPVSQLRDREFKMYFAGCWLRPQWAIV